MKVFEAYLQKLSSRDVAASIDRRALSPAGLLAVEPESWGLCAELARDEGIRWAAAWAEEIDAGFRLNAAFEHRGAYLVLRTRVPREKPELPSHAPYYWAADRCERHIQDMFGIRFKDHPDPRRWTRHQAWSKDQFPLRKDFPVQGAPQDETPPDKDYDFLSAKGPGVYEIPVGPVHAGIIEPGHFRFQAVGETVLNLEERLGYVHKGIEKIAEGRKPDELARLAGRVSGDSTVAHSWAACMAMERAAGIEPTARANFIRAMLCERERIINHLWDMGAICNDVAFTFAYYQLGRLREIWVRDNASIFGHRLLMDRIVPGGVNVDPHAEDLARTEDSIKALLKELGEIVSLLDFTESLEDRLVTTGILTVETAAHLGALGYVGRASGQSFDLRRDAPYPPYDGLKVAVPVEEQGDVASRFWIRYKEVRASCRLLLQLAEGLPEGDRLKEWKKPKNGAEGLGLVEGWRGETLCYVRFGAQNRIDRYYPRDPSIINWPALEKAVMNNIVPDFPVCNKSVNGSYSGQDL